MTARERVLWSLVAAAVAALAWVRAPAPEHSDFCSYYAAGRLALEGRAADAYDRDALEATHRAVHDVGRRAGPFLYSPLLLAPSAAFASLPLTTAARWNRGLGALALAAGLLSVLLSIEGAWLRAATAAAFALAHATAAQFFYENWTFWLFALVAFSVFAARRGGVRATGVAAALAVHLKAFVVFLYAPLVAGRRRRALAWAVGAGLGLAAVSTVATGVAPWQRYGGFLVATREAGVTPFYSKCSLAANLARLASEPREWVAAREPVRSLPVRAVFWLGLPLLGWGAWRLRAAPVAALGFGLAWTLLFVPQIWEHTEILLFAALPAVAPRWRWPVVALLAATAFYGPLQQGALARVLSGESPPATLGLLLLLYPSLNLLVLAGALAGAPGEEGG